MNFVRRLTMASTAAAAEFRRVYTNPAATAAQNAAQERRAAYSLQWAYYQNSAFESLAQWGAYRGRHRLYRHTRPIYNPARRLVDFYAGTTYQGAWATEPPEMILPTAAIPFTRNTPPPLLTATAQLWQWSNWRTNKSIMLRYGSCLGDCLVTVVDDLERAKVYLDVTWPGHVTDLDLDSRGNVEEYVIEYDAMREEGGEERAYTYRRHVTRDEITEYADGTITSRSPNPYTFVPAVWIKHTPTAAEHGESALRNIGKIDELCALASHAMDQAHRIMEAPILVAGDNINLTKPAGSTKNATVPYANSSRTPDSQESINVIQGGAGSDMKTVTLDPGEAIAHIDHMLAELERDHPELAMYTQLRGMSQVTGPAADRLFGDVAALVADARAQYDQASTQLFQMGIAIGGWRLSTGAWGPSPTRQQQAFAGYDLTSYERGDLDMQIQPRPLFVPSQAEQMAMEREQMAMTADRAYAQGQPAGIAARIQQAAQTRQQQPQQGQEAQQAQGAGMMREQGTPAQ
jgi:hypothetical protein